MKRLITTLAATLLLVACSDDSKAPTVDAPTKLDKGTSAEQGTTADKGGTTGDKGTTADKGGTTVDKGGTTADKGGKTPPITTSKHPGWQHTSCTGSSCHTLPVTGHTATKGYECAKCHGGNGACNPNSPNSKKKDHTSSLGCTSCHPGKHSYSANTDCVSCHYAAQGVVDCP